jgi:pentatricopeptide repeat protein
MNDGNDDINNESLTNDVISKLRFREVQRALQHRNLDTTGTFSAMKERLRAYENCGKPLTGSTPSDEECAMDESELNSIFAKRGIEFLDQSDPDYEFNELIRDTLEKAEQGHWKGASRKLKRLIRRYGVSSSDPRPIPEEVFQQTLSACMEDRLHGARAAEPARKVMDCMVEAGVSIPTDSANYCIKNAIGDGPNGSHDGHGGIDTALSMLAVMDQAAQTTPNPPIINTGTYSKVISTMAKEGSIEETLRLLRVLVVDKSETPGLHLFADVAAACVAKSNPENAEKVLTVLAYVKAAGYELDNIASTSDGVKLIACGVVAAEILDNIPLGLRLLTSAKNAEGCAPDRGDQLVVLSSSAAQRAATILHRRAINRAVQDQAWKLAVKLLEIMIERSLTPSPGVWRNVVTCCAKASKSRKATALLLDWVELAKMGRAEKPPLRVFNTVINACEICDEEELTLTVLDSMKSTHQTDGNLVTFNIALKRLARQGNPQACEGIIIGMLQAGIEPSVVSYTTAIAACVADPKKSNVAEEWLKRMRSRQVQPNVITYNTALASCLDGTLDGSKRASRIASQMLQDVQRQLDAGILTGDEYTDISPNFYTRYLGRQLMKQLKDNWEKGEINRKDAKSTIRVPLFNLVQFENSEVGDMAKLQKQAPTMQRDGTDDQVAITADNEEELEYSVAVTTHRVAVV